MTEPDGGNGHVLTVTLHGTKGCIHVYAYYPDTSNAPGRLELVALKEGRNGTAANLRRISYGARTYDGDTIHPVIEELRYTDESGTDATALRTASAYRYHGSSTGVGGVCAPGDSPASRSGSSPCASRCPGSPGC